VACGGDGQRLFTPAQFVRDLGEVLDQLALDDEITTHVYSPIPPSAIEAICATDPIAAGIGRFVRTDNDFLGFAGGTNAVTDQVHGTIALPK
jgi:hypothetical protein